MRNLIKRILREESYIDQEGNLEGFTDPTEEELINIIGDMKIDYDKFMEMSSPFALYMLLNSHGFGISLVEAEFLADKLEEIWEEGTIETIGNFTDTLNDILKGMRN